MHIAVCGDSFCTGCTDPNRAGTHFSEVLVSKYGYQVTNLARGGISNVGICLQIQTAIQLKVDLVVFRQSSSDRIDLVLRPHKFVLEKGLKNIIYPYECDSSYGSEYVGGSHAPVLSDNITTILTSDSNFINGLDIAVRRHVKEYASLFHDHKFQGMKDSWMFGYWKFMMQQHQVPFIDLNRTQAWAHINAYTTKNPDKLAQTVYHTDVDTQIVAADLLHEDICNLKGSHNG